VEQAGLFPTRYNLFLAVSQAAQFSLMAKAWILRPLYANICDVRLNSIRSAQGQAEVPDLRAQRQIAIPCFVVRGATDARDTLRAPCDMRRLCEERSDVAICLSLLIWIPGGHKKFHGEVTMKEQEFQLHQRLGVSNQCDNI
jgi:hypothetical protein